MEDQTIKDDLRKMLIGRLKDEQVEVNIAGRRSWAEFVVESFFSIQKAT